MTHITMKRFLLAMLSTVRRMPAWPGAMLYVLSFAVLIAGISQAQTTTPLYNAKLTGPLNGNGQDITLLDTITLGAGTATARLHILPSGTPTTAADGIKWGGDTAIYRSTTGTIAITGNLVVSGSITGSTGIVALDGNNIFTGTNTFNGSVVIGGSTMFQSAFNVSDNTVRTNIQTNLNLLPGTNVQAYSALLLAIAALNPQDGYIQVGNGSTWVTESGATARTSLGLGTGDNVTFTNQILTGTLAVTGASTLTGKVTAAGATSDATGLQLGTAGAFYGSGTGIVTDDAFSALSDVTLGDNALDITLVAGTLKLGLSDDLSLARSGSATATLTGSLAVTGSLTTGSPLGTQYGGTGLNNSALAANKFLYTSGTGVFGAGDVTAFALTLLDDANQAASRTTLGLGTAAVKDYPAAGDAAVGEVVIGSDTRLTNSRAPTGSAAGAGSDIEGTYPDTVTIKANSVALTTDTTGVYVGYLAAGTGVTIGGTNNQENAIPTISIGQAVSTASAPTFNGLTLTGSATGVSALLSGTFEAQGAVTLGDSGADITTVAGVLKLGLADDWSITRSGDAMATTTGSLTVTGGLTTTGGLTVAGTGTFASGSYSGTLTVLNLTSTNLVTANNLTVTGTATFSGAIAYDDLSLQTMALSHTSTPTIGEVQGLVVQNEIHVSKDGAWDTDTRTGLSAYDQYKPFSTISAAQTAALAQDTIRVHPADTEYTPPAEFGSTNRMVVLEGGAMLDGFTTTQDQDHIVTGHGTITGNIVVNNASADITVRCDTVGNVTLTTGTLRHHGTITGTVTLTAGTLHLHGQVTGNVSVAGGTLYCYDEVTGVVTVTGGTAYLRGRVTGSLAITTGTAVLSNTLERTTAGTAVQLTSGTLTTEGGAILASSASEVALDQDGGTWNNQGALSLRGTLTGSAIVGSSTGVTLLPGAVVTAVQSLTGAGALDLVSHTTAWVTTAADAATLADGQHGQVKVLLLKTDGGDGTLTPTTAPYTSILFNDAGDAVVLQFITGSGWVLLSNQGTTVTP